jgi:sarcosine oxidase delta subunit
MSPETLALVRCPYCGGRLELVEFNLRLRAAKNARQAITAIEAELQAHLQRFYRKA